MKPYYEDDAVTIYHGDCREILPKLEPNSVGLIATDPPFGIGKAAWDHDVMDLLKSASEGCARVLSEDGICFWFCSISLLPQTIEAVGGWLPYRWMFMWHASNRMQPGPIGFMKFSPALVLGSGKVHRNMADVCSVPNPSRGPLAGEHPTMKPLPLMAKIIDKASAPDQIVLDPFMGSGTTLRAAKDLNRSAIGIELEERYCEIAAERCSQEVLDLAA